MKTVRLFFRYLRSRRMVLAAFLLFSALFAVSFWLYHLPIRAMWYPAALCLVLGLGLLHRRHLLNSPKRLRRRKALRLQPEGQLPFLLLLFLKKLLSLLQRPLKKHLSLSHPKLLHLLLLPNPQQSLLLQQLHLRHVLQQERQRLLRPISRHLPAFA